MRSGTQGYNRRMLCIETVSYTHLVVLIFIMVFGFVMIYSASYYTAGMSKAYNNDPMYLLKNQIIYSMLGIIAMLVVASINYHFWCRFATIGYIACIGLIFLLKTPLDVYKRQDIVCVQQAMDRMNSRSTD